MGFYSNVLSQIQVLIDIREFEKAKYEKSSSRYFEIFEEISGLLKFSRYRAGKISRPKITREISDQRFLVPITTREKLLSNSSYGCTK